MLDLLKNAIRPFRDAVYTATGFFYDYLRFLKYGGWRGREEIEKRNYQAVKIYHRLEKSLSFRIRKKGSGWMAAVDLYRFMARGKMLKKPLGCQEKVAITVLDTFVRHTETPLALSQEIKNYLTENANLKSSKGGVLSLTSECIEQGKLDDPERFFLSRYSVRDFSDQRVESTLVDRALQLALKTPSVCSRQAWHVYKLETPDVIKRALKHQNGNSGFGHEIPCLLIVTADLKGFDTHGERYQHWIDGGMFSMSIIMAIHSLGLGACCLNWSKGIRDDLRLRTLINIDPAHTIVMMIAIGYPKAELKVCHSARRPLNEVLTVIN